MATVNLGRIKSVWRGTWATGTAYSRDDVVQEGVNSYICTQAHTAGATFAGDSANWDLMAQGAEIPSQTGNAGLALKTDGSNLSWGTAGGILQVKSIIEPDYVTFSNTNWNSISGFAVTITPQSTNSRLLVMASISLGSHNGDSWSTYTARILRNGASMTVGTRTGQFHYGIGGGEFYGGGKVVSVNVNEMVHPNSTSPQTFQVQIASTVDFPSINGNNYTDNWSGNGVSSLVVMEVAGEVV